MENARLLKENVSDKELDLAISFVPCDRFSQITLLVEELLRDVRALKLDTLQWQDQIKWFNRHNHEFLLGKLQQYFLDCLLSDRYDKRRLGLMFQEFVARKALDAANINQIEKSQTTTTKLEAGVHREMKPIAKEFSSGCANIKWLLKPLHRELQASLKAVAGLPVTIHYERDESRPGDWFAACSPEPGFIHVFVLVDAVWQPKSDVHVKTCSSEDAEGFDQKFYTCTLPIVQQPATEENGPIRFSPLEPDLQEAFIRAINKAVARHATDEGSLAPTKRNKRKKKASQEDILDSKDKEKVPF